MSEFVISTRYANAFMGIAEKNNLFPQIIAEVKFISKTLSNSKELRNLLVNPTINSQKKITILNEIFNSHISKELSDFLKFLVVKKRENLLTDIMKRFLNLADEKLNNANVNIISAIELSIDQKTNIETKLKEMLNKNIIAEYEIDNSIIGGFKAKFNDSIIDASIQHQLELLKKRLLKQSYLSN
ncbi:MAG: ATP synthase F1 subunit delta [Ignavibacteriales bacterium]|jgi:F-type H+-transporting ATPase subunit delta|nr:ATP synthase F1 subunit delta [Ignavibacteriales bacterium]MBK7981532.1 ATP synthase F1 subunit delta [Ignavibacteriota bacterium]